MQLGFSWIIFQICLGLFVLRKLPVIFKNSKVMVCMEECTWALKFYLLCSFPLLNSGCMGMVASWWPPTLLYLLCDHQHVWTLRNRSLWGTNCLLDRESCFQPVTSTQNTHLTFLHILMHNLMFLWTLCSVFGHSRYFGLPNSSQYSWGHPISFQL